MNSEHQPSLPSPEELLRGQLGRAHAPSDFEDVTILRVLLQQLPRATAPEQFEEEVLRRLNEDQRRSPRLRRIRYPRRWIAIGVGAAIAGGVAYYLATHTSPTTTNRQSAVEPVPLVVPVDTDAEEILSAPTPARTEPRQRVDSLSAPAAVPSKHITPGAQHNDEDE